MKTRFASLIQSPDTSEGALANSHYSTERSPITALLFEAKRTVILPLVTLESPMPSTEILLETRRKVDCSEQEHHA
jgi:hypothetical protein